MPSRALILFLSNLFIAEQTLADAVPSWVTAGSTMDSKYYYVVCSHDGLDPEDVKQIAESRCLTSAAKLGGVTVRIEQKTVQSLSGSDSGEVAEIQPLVRNIQLEWTNRYLLRVQNGYRVWLRGRIEKNKITNSAAINPSQGKAVASLESERVPQEYKRGTLFLTVVPKPDKVLLGGVRGQRVIEVESNVVQIEIKEGDQWVLAKKNRYRETKRDLPAWKNGETLSLTVSLEEEI